MSTEMTPEKVAEIRRQAAENWGMAAYGTLPQWVRDIVALCDEVTRLTEELARHKFEVAEISINDYRKAIGITEPAPDRVRIVYGAGTASFAKGEPHDAAHASVLPFLTEEQRQSKEFKEWMEGR